MKNRRHISILLIPLLLFIPLIAMEFTDEVNWDLMDFVIAGILLYSTTQLIKLVMRKIKTRKNRIALSIIILIIFLATWAELAVGIFGTPLSGN